MRTPKPHPMRLPALLLTGLLPAAAQAFNISARSDNILYDDAFLQQQVERVAAEVGHSIPDDPRIRVKIYSRGLESRVDGALIYLHRIQLTKAFSGLPPYPFAGYLPLRSTERYGIDDEDGMDRKLDETIRAFFEMMKEVPAGLEPDPAAGAATDTDEAAAIAGPDAPNDFRMSDVGDGKAPAGSAPAAAPSATPAPAPAPPAAPPVSTEEGAWAPLDDAGIPAAAVTGGH